MIGEEGIPKEGVKQRKSGARSSLRILGLVRANVCHRGREGGGERVAVSSVRVAVPRLR